MHVGFLNPLSYSYVLANSLSQRQIFKYLAPGIAYVMIINENNVTVQSLRAYDTTVEYGYITTLAFVYIPSSSVSLLKSAVRSPGSLLYNNPDAGTKTLMSLINPAIPIEADAVLDSNSSTSETTPTPPAGLSSGSKVGIGIAVPLFIVALLLFALLLWRRRKVSHHESITGKEENENNLFEMPADAITFELHNGKYDYELSAEERKEMQGDLRRRQELAGPECARELESTSTRSQR